MAVVIAAAVAAIFVTLGAAKILALAPMLALAAKAGFSVRAYRGIGVLEVAGATGVALGPVVPLFGVLAGAGLLALLTGALVIHARNRDQARDMAPAVVCVMLVAAYLVVLFWAAS